MIRDHGGRTLDALLDTFGPSAVSRGRSAPVTPHQPRLNRAAAPSRGHRVQGRGWAPVAAPLAVYHASTHQIGGLFPLLATSPSPAVGAPIGYDVLSGSAFYCHPVEWVLQGLAANPNVVIFGEPGKGKSSTVLGLLLRMMNFGVRAFISGDVKGEYSPLLRALGITPIALGHGSGARLNALDLGPLTARWTRLSVDRQREEINGLLARWVRLLVALAHAQHYSPSITDELVLALVLRRLLGVTDGATHLHPITVPDVYRELADPDDTVWQDARFAGRRQFLDALRPMTDALANLMSGALAGLFDQPTNITVDWHAPAQSMDLSGLRSRGDQALAVALTCLGSWSGLMTDLQDDGDLRIVVRDEVWRQLQLGLHAVQALDSELRLSRHEQKIQVLVAHKPSDFLAVGARGSQEAAIARDLLALCSTRVLFGQSTRIGEELAENLMLSEKEQQVITGWCNERKGRALWKIEAHPGYKVQTVRSSVEQRHFDTSAKLRSQTTLRGKP